MLLRLFHCYQNCYAILETAIMLTYRCAPFTSELSTERLPVARPRFYSLRRGGGAREETPRGGRSAIKADHSIDQRASGNISPLTKLAVAYP